MSEKHEKSRFVGIRWTRKQRKTAFLHEGKQEISKNWLSLTRENKNSVKIGFLSRGETRKQLKTAFPHGGEEESSEKRISRMRENQKSADDTFPKLGKRENVENRISQTWEEQKTEENGCPNIEKTEKRRKNAFPNLGRIENLKGCISQPLEEQKILLGAFPTPWASDFFCFPFIQPLGRAIFSVFRSFKPSDGLFFWFSAYPRPRTSISMRSFPPIRLLFGIVNSRVSCRVTNRNAAELTDLIRVCRILGIPRTIRVCIYRI